MRPGANNLAWGPGNWRAGAVNSPHAQHGDSNRMNSMVPRTPTFQLAEAGDRSIDRWQSSEERVGTGTYFYGVTGFPRQHFSQIRIFFLGSETAPRANPQLTQFIQEPPPRIRDQWHIPTEEGSRLTQVQQRNDSKQLKKHVYNPVKFKPRRWSFYYRENATISSYSKEDGRDDDGKSCPICLEDFVPNEELLITPCKHMFHDECILPWVKCHNQCPVCRFEDILL